MKFLLKISAIIMLAAFLNACKSVKILLPKGPVLSKIERQKIEKNKKLEISYTKESSSEFPLIPFQVWAATYDLDIVIVSDNPKWNMHELARLQTPKGPVWIMKDALNSTMEQSIVADIDDVESWLPEIPVKRKFYPVKVKDSSSAKMLNLDFEYENMAGEICKIHYEGPFPTKKQPKRNGSTMGHSKSQLIAVLDLPVRNFAKKANIYFDGKAAKIKKILGMVPFQMALKQTQAGISIGKLEQYKFADKILTKHLDKKIEIVQEWILQKRDEAVILSQDNELRTINYQYNILHELEKAYVDIKIPQHRAFEISFYPALPDFGRTFNGTCESIFIMDVNGQKSHAMGKIISECTESGVKISIEPLKPWWVNDRPMKSEINAIGEKHYQIFSLMR